MDYFGPSSRPKKNNSTTVEAVYILTFMITSSYKLSFTAGGLLLGRSLIVVSEFIRQGGWENAEEIIQKNNLLQSRTQSSSKRILREICKRLQLLTNEQLVLLQTGTHLDQKQLLWLGICKRYELLANFSSEVVRSRFLELDPTIKPSDFDTFLESQSAWHSELEKITDGTRAKLRQVTFRMLREADIISSDNVIQPVVLSPDIARAIQLDSASQFSVFPVWESNVREVLL